MSSTIRLGALELADPVLLAPMAGTTDFPFRKAAQAAGAAYVVSEMVAGDQLARSRRDMVRRTAGAGVVTPLVIQLAGREERWMGLGAKLAEEAGADVIDINMGCPSKTVTSGQSGSALMRDPDHALRLVEATVRATNLPVTLKMRLGWDEDTLNAPEIAKRAESAGVGMIVVHGRTRCQFFNGQANWVGIRHTVDAVSIPVIANGDIETVADAKHAIAASGAAGVMIGRATQGRPWLPAALALGLRSGEALRAPSQERIYSLLWEIYEDALVFYGLELGSKVARKHISWAIQADAVALDPATRRTARASICQMTGPGEVHQALESIFLHQDWRREAA